MSGRVLSEEKIVEIESEWYPDYSQSMSIPDLIATIRDRDAKVEQLIHAKARLADKNMELEAEVKRLRKIFVLEVVGLEAEVKRLREELEWYGNPTRYAAVYNSGTWNCAASVDAGRRARQILQQPTEGSGE